MNVYDGIHWNIYEILPYQRNFNFINGIRSLGKTYTTQMYLLDKAINRHDEFVYLVRTQDEKKKGVLQNAFEKVTAREFPDIEFEYTTEEMYFKDGAEEDAPRVLIGYCIALSEAVKVKKRSFPRVKYMMFDEYMLEGKQTSQYVTGWKEPDLLLSIYHTIDREEDRVMCFLMGNNTKFYNPYHMHPAFNIPIIEKGKIWTSENVLYQWADGSKALEEKKSTSKFLRMIDKTTYGDYAKDGNFVDDNYSFLGKPTSYARYIMTLEYNDASFGVYSDGKVGLVFVSDKVDHSCFLKYALTLEDHTENTMLTKGRATPLKWLAGQFKLGNVRFSSMEVKAKIEGGIALLL